MRDHSKLTVFERADEAAVLIYRATGGFPRKALGVLIQSARNDQQPERLSTILVDYVNGHRYIVCSGR